MSTPSPRTTIRSASEGTPVSTDSTASSAPATVGVKLRPSPHTVPGSSRAGIGSSRTAPGGSADPGVDPERGEAAASAPSSRRAPGRRGRSPTRSSTVTRWVRPSGTAPSSTVAGPDSAGPRAVSAPSPQPGARTASSVAKASATCLGDARAAIRWQVRAIDASQRPRARTGARSVHGPAPSSSARRSTHPRAAPPPSARLTAGSRPPRGRSRRPRVGTASAGRGCSRTASRRCRGPGSRGRGRGSRGSRPAWSPRSRCARGPSKEPDALQPRGGRATLRMDVVDTPEHPPPRTGPEAWGRAATRDVTRAVRPLRAQARTASSDRAGHRAQARTASSDRAGHRAQARTASSDRAGHRAPARTASSDRADHRAQARTASSERADHRAQARTASSDRADHRAQARTAITGAEGRRASARTASTHARGLRASTRTASRARAPSAPPRARPRRTRERGAVGDAIDRRVTGELCDANHTES